MLKKEKELEAELQAAMDAAKQKTKSEGEGGPIDVDVYTEAAETLQNVLDTVLVAGLREKSPVVVAARKLITRLLEAKNQQLDKNAVLEALRAAIATARLSRESSPLKTAYDVAVERFSTTVVLSGDLAVQHAHVGPSRSRKKKEAGGEGEGTTSEEKVTKMDPAAVPLTQEAELLLRELGFESLLKEATTKSRAVLKQVDMSVESESSTSTASITASLNDLQDALDSALNGDGATLQPTNPFVVDAQAVAKNARTAIDIIQAVTALRSRIQVAEKCWEAAKQRDTEANASSAKDDASATDLQPATAMAELKSELEKALAAGVGHQYPVVLDARKLLTAWDDAMESEDQLARERLLKARLVAACNTATETRAVKPLVRHTT